MTTNRYDAVVIGGGPGGSAAATFLARAGRRVLLLEKEVFPRFHIGESLLPYNRPLFEELGVLPKLEAAGLLKKYGAQFHLSTGAKTLYLVFRQGRFTRHTEAFQVERATFDHLLLKHARECGADAREGWTVSRFTPGTDWVRIEARDPDGQTQVFEGAFLIDASGRSNLTGNQEGLREIHPKLKKIAVFGHFSGVMLDEGRRGSDTLIVRMENKWFWLIPLSLEKVSVGCVMDKDEFVQARATPAELFTRIWQSSPVLRERMQNARLLGQMQTTSDFSYFNRRLVGPRLLRVGDAAGFMDPIFSAGVYLAMFSGKLAAELVSQSLQAGDDGARRLKHYEKRVRDAMHYYWEIVEHYYTNPFMEIFLEPRDNFSMPAAVTAVLAGELEAGWKIRWRMRLFYWLVKLQARWPLVPRISWTEPPMDDPAAGRITSRIGEELRP